ncbi:DEAD/DEAH box helicase [Candidatus Woesearchaeota archaeon]|nr:DEAD/DEAH box helicase [Candidatus Woesearchaeota archaeon]
MLFEKLGIRPEIGSALKELGIDKPTEIQEKAIPLIKEKKDVVGISRTGSGKTAAFSVPILETLEPHGLQALVLVPTRELAIQIAKEMKKFGKNIKFHVTTVYGGVSLEPQVKSMRKTNVIVATPGRLLDHLERKNVDLSEIKCFVLDEADKMVDMGFIDDITRIFKCTPKEKQVLLFGATISHEIKEIERRFMNDPVTVKAKIHVEKDLLKQFYYNVRPHEKFSLLVHLLKTEEIKRGIIFCSTRAGVDTVSKNLHLQKIKSERIHGKMPQNKRIKTIERFNDGNVQILVASTVAARGLHIENVSHVINYDLSQDSEEYIHRIGRTARAGESGKAITLLSQRDHDTFNSILSRYPVKIEELTIGDYPKVSFDSRDMQRGRSSGFGNSRPSSGSSRGYRGEGFGGRRDPNKPRYGGSGPRGRTGGSPSRSFGSRDSGRSSGSSSRSFGSRDSNRSGNRSGSSNRSFGSRDSNRSGSNFSRGSRRD